MVLLIAAKHDRAPDVSRLANNRQDAVRRTEPCIERDQRPITAEGLAWSAGVVAGPGLDLDADRVRSVEAAIDGPTKVPMHDDLRRLSEVT
jgi:hypothetical protein